MFIFFFSPIQNHRLFFIIHRLRIPIAVNLAFFLFVAPLSAGVSAAREARLRQVIASTAPGAFQSINSRAEEKSGKNGVDSFIIEMVDGVSNCREALPAEVSLTLPRPDDRGIPVRELLEANLENQQSLQGDVNSLTGLTINLNALQQLQNDSNRATVIAAFQRAANVWMARIKSPVTITVNIDYGVNAPDGRAFPAGVLGATSSGSISAFYPDTRDRLVLTASAPGEAGIYNSLPSSVIPTDTGDGSVISISRSQAQPLGFIPLNPNEIVATIAFNKNFAFDFNPDDGINGGAIDFVAVAAHEIGHALGFVSNAGEGSTTPVTLWDMFRFRPGTTAGTFATAQRIMSIGGSQAYFTGQTFVVGAVGTGELGLSTGGPDPAEGDGDGNQSSHWKADELTGQYIGIMDPTIATGVHKDATENDFSALETLGWNLVSSVAPPPPPPPASNDNFANAQNISGCSGSVTGTNLNATKEAGEPNHLAPATGGGMRSVWYQWQAPSSGDVTVTTAGSGFDTVLAVYTGTAVNALTLIVNNDDIPDVPGQPHITTSSVTFAANAGTTYRIAVDGFNNDGSGGDMGTIKLNWLAANCVDSSVQLSSATAMVAEGAGSAVIDVTRTGNTATQVSVNYVTVDGSATQKGDYLFASGRITFAPNETTKSITVLIIDDVYQEGTESFSLSLSNPIGTSLGAQSVTVVSVLDNDTAPPITNPLDNSDARFFVRQHYIDFLNREPDQSGSDFWSHQISDCGTNQACIELKRINVSGAFFLSIEFQETGYLVERMYKAAYGDATGNSTFNGAHQLPVPIVRFNEFLVDSQQIGRGVVIGQPGADQLLESNKVAFANDFVSRTRFSSAFASTLTPTQFVDALFTHAGVTPSASDRTAAINEFGGATNTADIGARARAVRRVAENNDLNNAEKNKAFVLMQYFGYLRRDPNAGQDVDHSGYDFWLTKLLQFNGNFVSAEMVKAFIVSAEYRQRFGPG